MNRGGVSDLTLRRKPGVTGALAQWTGRGVIDVDAHTALPVISSTHSVTTVVRMPALESSLAISERPAFLSSQYDDLRVTLSPNGGTLRVWSEHADRMEVVIFDGTDLDWATDTIPLERRDGGVWQVTTELLHPGARYAIRIDGPHGPGNTFNPQTLLLEPYTKGLTSGGFADWRSVVVDGGFDWGGVQKPATALIAPSSTKRT